MFIVTEYAALKFSINSSRHTIYIVKQFEYRSLSLSGVRSASKSGCLFVIVAYTHQLIISNLSLQNVKQVIVLHFGFFVLKFTKSSCECEVIILHTADSRYMDESFQDYS